MASTLSIVLIVFLAASCFALIILLLGKRSKEQMSLRASQTDHSARDVGNFYNDQTNNFLKVYGEVIQAFRTTDVTKLLDYQVETIGFEEGQRVLDAGCGVCGPARYFAKNAGVQVEAITISEDQVEKAKKYIAEDGLEGKVNVTHGDYHRLEEYYESDSFDVVYFLESFGHATNHEQVINSAWGMLKPGGKLYIKDLFIKEAAIQSLADDIQREVKNINDAYRYNIADLYEILKFVRKKGYILSSVKTIDLPSVSYTHLRAHETQ